MTDVTILKYKHYYSSILYIHLAVYIQSLCIYNNKQVELKFFDNEKNAKT